MNTPSMANQHLKEDFVITEKLSVNIHTALATAITEINLFQYVIWQNVDQPNERCTSECLVLKSISQPCQKVNLSESRMTKSVSA